MASTEDLIRLLGTRFVARKDVKAFQSDDGAWYPDRSAMTLTDFNEHLAGNKTLGHYLLDQEDNCKYFAFDIDLVKHDRDCDDKECPGGCLKMVGIDGVTYSVNPRELWYQGHEVYPNLNPLLTTDLLCMAEGLARTTNRTLGIPVAIATSGHKGLHVYGFTGLIPAEAARLMAVGVLEGYGCFEPFRGQNFWRHTEHFPALDIEIFPKQTTLEGKDLGNLMKLPLGKHRVTKQWAQFIAVTGRYDKLVSMNAENALQGDLPWE